MAESHFPCIDTKTGTLFNRQNNQQLLCYPATFMMTAAGRVVLPRHMADQIKSARESSKQWGDGHLDIYLDGDKRLIPPSINFIGPHLPDSIYFALSSMAKHYPPTNNILNNNNNILNDNNNTNTSISSVPSVLVSPY